MVRRLLQRLWRDQDGVAMIEAAFVVPVLVFVTFAAVETGMALAASALLDGAVREAARVGVTGYSPDGTSRSDYILNTVKAHASMLDPAKLTLSTKVFSSFSAMQSNPSGGASGVGNGGDIVLYTVSYTWTFLGGYGAKIFGVPNIPLSASLAVRNEPF